MYNINFKKIQTAIKDSSSNILITILIVCILSIIINLFLINDVALNNALIVSQIYQKFYEFITHKNNTTNNNYYFADKNNIYIINNYQVFQLNNTFEKIDVYDIPEPWFTVKLKNNIYIEYPFFIKYNFDDTSLKLKITFPHKLTIQLLFLMIFLVIIINFLYFLSLRKNTIEISDLTSMAVYFALSQRTTSYLVRIIHHKLNSPVKVITTKSRMLINTINNTKNEFSESVITKANDDYSELENSLNTILHMTQKLKSYNELSQHESNIYNLFKMSKETIDFFTDDIFDIKIHHSIRLFDFDKTNISSHIIIQVFINQIKFSLSKLADRISINVFSQDTNSVILFYSDNGNILEHNVQKLCARKLNLYELSAAGLESDVYDFLLNFILLNSNAYTNIKLLESNKTGNVYSIKIPIIKKDIKQQQINNIKNKIL